MYYYNELFVLIFKCRVILICKFRIICGRWLKAQYILFLGYLFQILSFKGFESKPLFNKSTYVPSSFCTFPSSNHILDINLLMGRITFILNVCFDIIALQKLTEARLNLISLEFNLFGYLIMTWKYLKIAINVILLTSITTWLGGIITINVTHISSVFFVQIC